jgi:molybdopterin synthase catalytic subunit
MDMTVQLNEFSRIQSEAFDLGLFDDNWMFPECGGIGIFIGTVRNHHQGRAVEALKYTAYAPVAEKMIRQIEHEIQQKYQVSYVRVVHRVGHLDIGDTAIIAVAYAAHRREAFEACEEAVERVKHEVPVWKEEFYKDGTSQFVEGCCIRKDRNQDHTVSDAVKNDSETNRADHIRSVKHHTAHESSHQGGCCEGKHQHDQNQHEKNQQTQGLEQIAVVP